MSKCICCNSNITQSQVNLIDYFLASAESLGFGNQGLSTDFISRDNVMELLDEFLPQFYVEFEPYLDRPLPKGFQSTEIVHKEDVE